jgi:hypothetical protein
MPVIKQYKCDGCGAEKREANHWWAVTVQQIDTRALGGEDDAIPAFVLTELQRAEYCDIDITAVLCGQECVAKRASEFMGELKKEADARAARHKDGVKQ